MRMVNLFHNEHRTWRTFSFVTASLSPARVKASLPNLCGSLGLPSSVISGLISPVERLNATGHLKKKKLVLPITAPRTLANRCVGSPYEAGTVFALT